MMTKRDGIPTPSLLAQMEMPNSGTGEASKLQEKKALADLLPENFNSTKEN